LFFFLFFFRHELIGIKTSWAELDLSFDLRRRKKKKKQTKHWTKSKKRNNKIIITFAQADLLCFIDCLLTGIHPDNRTSFYLKLLCVKWSFFISFFLSPWNHFFSFLCLLFWVFFFSTKPKKRSSLFFPFASWHIKKTKKKQKQKIPVPRHRKENKQGFKTWLVTHDWQLVESCSEDKSARLVSFATSSSPIIIMSFSPSSFLL